MPTVSCRIRHETTPTVGGCPRALELYHPPAAPICQPSTLDAAINDCDTGYPSNELSCIANDTSQCINLNQDSYGLNCLACDDCNDNDENVDLIRVGCEDIDNDGYDYGGLKTGSERMALS